MAEAKKPDDKQPAAPGKPPAPLVDRTPRCPTCGAEVSVYAGSNPHKLGTAFCPSHGRVETG